MRINYITYDSWWDTDKTILQQLCKHYVLNCYVLNPKYDERKFQTKEIEGVNKIREVNQNCRDRNPKSFLIALYFLSIILRDIRKKNILNVFVPGKNPWLLFLFFLFAPKKQTLICIHNYKEHSGGKNLGLREYIKTKYYRHFRYFLFYSQQQADEYRKHHIEGKAFCLNMPLKDFGIPNVKRTDQSVRFLFFGMIKEYKRLDLFIRAAGLVADKRGKFIIAGFAPHWETYENLIVDKDLFELNIRFVDNDEIPNFFCNSDFLVLPYDDATQSGPMLIALNYALPVISSDIKEFRGFVEDGVNGFLFEKGDPNSLANVIKKLLNLTPEERDNIKKAQNKRKLDYISTSNTLQNFADIVKQMTK